MNKTGSNITLLLLIFTLAITVFPATASAEIQSVAEAINKSGRQRMLTQRIVRAYSQIGLSVDRRASEKMLKDAVALFDKQLQELTAFALTDKLKKRVNKVHQLWPAFKKTATGKVNKAGAARLLETNDDLLKVCHQLVLEFQDFSGTKGARLVNIAGRQRMLSQRISKFYMLKEWGLKGAGLEADSNQAFTEFRGALLTLQESQLNTKNINLALNNAGKHFDEFQTMLNLTGTGARIKVSEKANLLLTYFNRITGMYQTLAENQ